LLKNSALSFPDFGTKPKNVNFSVSKPDKVKATKTLDGPGIDTISTLLLINFLTSVLPGSEMRGVPASEIIAIDLSSSNKLSISSIFFNSLPLKYERTSFFWFKCDNSFFATRVSSA
jgi:hypothetical protein